MATHVPWVIYTVVYMAALIALIVGAGAGANALARAIPLKPPRHGSPRRPHAEPPKS